MNIDIWIYHDSYSSRTNDTAGWETWSAFFQAPPSIIPWPIILDEGAIWKQFENHLEQDVAEFEPARHHHNRFATPPITSFPCLRVYLNEEQSSFMDTWIWRNHRYESRRFLDQNKGRT
jgi:hypothetical protein